MRDLRHLIRQILGFSLPLLLIAATVVLVDVFDFLPGPELLDHDLKHRSAAKLNYALWKTAEFSRAPRPNILLGDSRMNAVSTDTLRSLTGRPWANLAYGGGSLTEALETFEFARSRIRLERVAIGISIDVYNDANRRNRVDGVLAMRRNPLLYLVNRNVLEATFRALVARVTGHPPAIGRPDVDKDTFWNHQLNRVATEVLESFAEPVEYRKDLEALAQTCAEEGIELRFVIFPTHDDLRRRVAEAGLAERDANMRRELARLAPVYDFDWSNDFTSDRANFGDPYHCRRELLGRVLRGIWGEDGRLVRRPGSTGA